MNSILSISKGSSQPEIQYKFTPIIPECKITTTWSVYKSKNKCISWLFMSQFLVRMTNQSCSPSTKLVASFWKRLFKPFFLVNRYPWSSLKRIWMQYLFILRSYKNNFRKLFVISLGVLHDIKSQTHEENLDSRARTIDIFPCYCSKYLLGINKFKQNFTCCFRRHFS